MMAILEINHQILDRHNLNSGQASELIKTWIELVFTYHDRIKIDKLRIEGIGDQ